jgi:hypothetical protein
MGMLAWVMMAIALWHFTIFLPDRFWSGIVGAFLGALLGGIVSGLLISGFSVPGNDDISVLTALYAVPGAIAGVALVYWIGIRQEDAADEAAYRT